MGYVTTKLLGRFLNNASDRFIKKTDAVRKNNAEDLYGLINALSIGESPPTDNDYFISQYINGGTNVTSYHRRKISALLTYIKGKLAKVATSGSYTDLSNKPTSLKNPQAITFTGAVTGAYDGSTAKTVNIPSISGLLTEDKANTTYAKKTDVVSTENFLSKEEAKNTYALKSEYQLFTDLDGDIVIQNDSIPDVRLEEDIDGDVVMGK